MKKTKLENWISEIEGLPVLDREALEALQLKRLNSVLEKLHERNSAYPKIIQERILITKDDTKQLTKNRTK